MEITNIHIGAAVIVGLLFPGYAMLYGGSTHRILSAHPEKKAQVMQVTAFQLMTLSIMVLVPILYGKDELNHIGLGFVSNPFWFIGLFTVSFLGLWLFNQIEVTLESAQKFIKDNAPIAFLFPANPEEYKLTVLVSFIAGICEEIVYRGFLLTFLLTYMPMVPAILLANLPFALAHLTSTGLRNSIQAFILALIFTAAFLLTGSLWLAILLHILVDLYATTHSYRSNCMIDGSNEPTSSK